MKHNGRRFLRCIAGITVIAALGAFVLLWGGAEPEAVPVRLSRESGFYDEPFALEMEAGGLEIRYTLDSTEPNENSILYTGPILIEDASSNENVYSRIKDVCLDLDEELLAKGGKSPKFHYSVPSQPIDKATVVRAVCFDMMGNCGDEVTAVYFVGFDGRKAYDGLNIIAITTDPANLFDYETGIYVLGKTFDDAMEKGLFKDEANNYLFWPANYWNKGKQWERRASIYLFDDQREMIASGDFGIRIQGRGSRGRLPKSLNIYAREEYGTQSLPCDALFDEDYALKKLNLNSGANGVDTLLTDYLVNQLSDGLKFDTRHYEPYALFLDGEYWGQ